MRRLLFTAAAEADVEEIGDYIAADNPRRAEVFVAELRESCRDILGMPERFPVVPRFRRSGIRRRVHDQYLIFYRITVQAVEILRVLHGARDYEAMLFPNE